MLAVNPGKKYKKKFSSPRVSKLIFTTLVSQKFLFFLNKSTLKIEDIEIDDTQF